MNFIQPTGESPSRSWRRAFASALIRLQPDVNPDAADELSDSAYASLADLDPGEAATLYRPGDQLVESLANDKIRRHFRP